MTDVWSIPMALLLVLIVLYIGGMVLAAFILVLIQIGASVCSLHLRL